MNFIFNKAMFFWVDYTLICIAILFHLWFQFFRSMKNGIGSFLWKAIWCSDSDRWPKTFTLGFILQSIVVVIWFLYWFNYLQTLSINNSHIILILSILFWIFGEIVTYYETLVPFRGSFCNVLVRWLWITLSLYIIGYCLFVL